MENIGAIISTIAGFVLILLLAYWAVRILGRGFAANSMGRMIQVLERISLGADKQLLIVKTADRVFLLGVTAHHIEKLEELQSDKFPVPLSPQREESFLDIFKRALDFKKEGESGDEQTGNRKNGESE